MGMVNVHRYMQNRKKKMNSYYILISTTGLGATVYYVLPSSSYSFSQHPQLVKVSVWCSDPQTWEILSSWCSALIGSCSLILTFITVHGNTRRWPKVSPGFKTFSSLCSLYSSNHISPISSLYNNLIFLLLFQWYEKLKIIN